MSRVRVAVFLFLVVTGFTLVGCASTGPRVTETITETSPDGRTITATRREDGELEYELTRIINSNPVRGTGSYSHPVKSTAREVALNLAINDLGRKLGDVVQNSDSTIIQQDDKDTILNIIRTQTSNVISGYEVISDSYDDETGEAVVWIEMNVEGVSREIVRRYQR